MERIFEGKKALVIGGSKSVGGQVCALLKDAGADVTCVSRSKPALDEVAFVSVDFQSDLDWDKDDLGVPALKECLVQSDLLFICYGPFVQKTFDETNVADWKMMALQDYALPGALISSVLPHMIQQKWGRIVVFGGTRTESVKNFRSNAAYAGAKTGVSVIVKSVAAEYGSFGITCNCILPGFTNHAPENTECVDEKTLAQHALFAASHGELNGMLMNVDRGWVPETR